MHGKPWQFFFPLEKPSVPQKSRFNRHRGAALGSEWQRGRSGNRLSDILSLPSQRRITGRQHINAGRDTRIKISLFNLTGDWSGALNYAVVTPQRSGAPPSPPRQVFFRLFIYPPAPRMLYLFIHSDSQIFFPESVSARRSAHESALRGVVSAVFRRFQTCARLNNLRSDRLMTGSDHVETKRPGWLLIRDGARLFPSRSLFLLCVCGVCVCVCVCACDAVGLGREYVCVGVSVLQEAVEDYSSLRYTWRGGRTPRDICRKLILSSVHHSGFWSVTGRSLCGPGSCELCIL